MDERLLRPPYNTEYSDNYNMYRGQFPPIQSRWNTGRTLLRPSDRRPQTAYGGVPYMDTCHSGAPFTSTDQYGRPTTSGGMMRDPSQFQSETHRSVYRETTLRKDDRGRYIDPFENIATKPYGRRLRYDPTHPDMMYASQWSSELADPPGPYSFPTTTGLDAAHPWTKDLQWQAESETGHWPTRQWKQWTNEAVCPPYDGYGDQIEYSQYKVQMPY